MAPKEQPASAASHKPRKSFAVGPANLPDGVYKRKVQKIRKDLIHKASVKRSYAKIKSREQQPQDQDHGAALATDEAYAQAEPASLDPHPARQALIDHEPTVQVPSKHTHNEESRDENGAAGFTRNPRTNPYARPLGAAAKEQARRETVQQERKRADRERREKLDRRERWRREMAKAKGLKKNGKQGPRKLGRESKVLLEKVQLMSSSGR